MAYFLIFVSHRGRTIRMCHRNKVKGNVELHSDFSCVVLYSLCSFCSKTDISFHGKSVNIFTCKDKKYIIIHRRCKFQYLANIQIPICLLNLWTYKHRNKAKIQFATLGNNSLHLLNVSLNGTLASLSSASNFRHWWTFLL